MLDVMRGVAISLVLLHHIGFRFADVPRDSVAEFLWAIGWSGVDIFFVISGFLITGILLSLRERAEFRGFFIKRAFRIIPLYFCALCLFALLSLMTSRGDISKLWLNAFFLTGWMVPFVGAEHLPYVITWSLSVEEFAYLLFGFAAALWKGRFDKIIIWFAVWPLLLRLILVALDFVRVQDVYYFPLTRIDSIAFGGLVALGYFRLPAKIIWIISLVGIGALIYGCLFVYGQYSKGVAILAYTGLPVAVACLVGYAVRYEGRSGWLMRFASYVGRRSYFVYLFHVFVIAGMALPFMAPLRSWLGFWGIFAVVLLSTLSLAEVSWRYFEFPLICRGRELAKR